jgi:APA family basic amino acid/polyamine antiporter
MSSSSSQPSLNRSIGLAGVVFLVISSMIGSGVFKKVSGMSADLGSPGLVLAAWAAAGLISLLGALSTAEIASMFPEAGGQYVYFKQIYGRFFAYLFGWATFSVIQSATIASVAFVFAESLVDMAQLPDLSASLPEGLRTFGLDPDFLPFSNLTVKIFAALLVWGLVLVNWRGIKIGNTLASVLATTIVVSIAAIIVMCFGFSDGSFSNLTNGTEGIPIYDRPGPDGAPPIGLFGAFFGAMLAAFWAYEGWITIGFLGGEIKDANRNLPRGLILGTLAVTLVYVVVHVAYLYAMPLEQIAAMKGGPGIAAVNILGSFAGNAGIMFLSLLILCSTFNATNASVVAAPRVYYALAKDGLFFPSASKIHPKFQTPHVALLMQGVWATALVFSGSFDALTDMLIFASFIFYGAGALGVIILRIRMPELHRPYKVPFYPVVPVLFAAFSALLVVNTIIDQPLKAGMGLILIGIGVPFYFLWDRKR